MIIISERLTLLCHTVRVLPPFETYTYVPEGSVVQMICTDAEKSVPVEMLQWQIRLAQTQFTIPALFSSLRDTFISNGINESRQDSMTLQLTISNAVDNNATEVICIKNVVTELSRTTIIVFNGISIIIICNNNNIMVT